MNQSRPAGSLPLLVPVRPITSPRVPSATAVRSASTAGEKCTGKAVMSTTPTSRQAATMASASATVVASGFSHSTCTPRRAASSTRSLWCAFALVTTMASGPSGHAPQASS